jgi:hypothetical protein
MSRAKKQSRQLTRADVGPNDPLRLGVAAVLAFPDGTMTAAGLRREKFRGRLVIERVAAPQLATLLDRQDGRHCSNSIETQHAKPPE